MPAVLPKDSKRLTEGIPAIYLVDKKLVSTSQASAGAPDTMVKRYTIGEPVRVGAREKVIMIIGETGAGKTTLINAMLNYSFGIKKEDDFRLQLTAPEEESGRTQAFSQTQSINGFTINPPTGSPVNYMLTIVDTPGFGDPGGIERDKQIMTMIHKFFSEKKAGSFDHLDAVGLVVKAPDQRLTETQKYIFQRLCAIFAKDIADNIFLMVTFSDLDDEEPKVLESVRAHQLPFVTYFNFNNCMLFKTCRRPMQKFFWDMGQNSLELFFRELASIVPKSLMQTVAVLESRKRLEDFIIQLQIVIKETLSKLDELEQYNRLIQQKHGEINSNKNFEYEVTHQVIKTEQLPAGKYVTNCTVCNRTCHYPCHIPNDGKKWLCNTTDIDDRVDIKNLKTRLVDPNNMSPGHVVEWSTEEKPKKPVMVTSYPYTDSHCRICPQKCNWKLHVNNQYRYIIGIEKKTETDQQLKARFLKARGDKTVAEAMKQEINREILQKKKETDQLINNAKQCIAKLSEIALRPNPLSTVDYIDILIKAEEAEHADGWNGRCDQLQRARERAQLEEELGKAEHDVWSLDISAR